VIAMRVVKMTNDAITRPDVDLDDRKHFRSANRASGTHPASLSLRINKTDRNDAVGLAELLVSGWTHRLMQVRSRRPGRGLNRRPDPP
jgi:hypothetical protein